MSRPDPGPQPRPRPPHLVRSVRKERGLPAKSHTFHLVATVFTCGLWGLLVWLPLWVFRMVFRRKIVTRYYYD
jgi:hypothetical protein